MVFWILIALLTVAAALAVLVPLSRRPAGAADASARADEAVYREQLAAIEADLERGLIEAEAAEAARTEIGRRLLSAHDRGERAKDRVRARRAPRISQGVAVILLPALTLGLYSLYGSPGTPDQPLVARLSAPASEQSVDILVARVERHLAQNPEDGQGWAVLAPVYLSMGRPDASARAYANALRILGPRQQWLTDMGEALTMASQGMVTAEARDAFERAVALEPGAVKPRFFLALSLGQEGRRDEAVAAWRKLLENADPAAAWVPAARRELAQLTGGPATPLPGPDAEAVAAAQGMADDDRTQMIRGMVSGLAERLERDGGTADEWLRLIRSYVVLGEREEAARALSAAKTALADEDDALSRIKDAAGELGLSGS